MRAGAAFAIAATVATSPVPTMAQDGVSESRVRKIEAEIRALQRQVFPGGDERYFEPQITSEQGTGNQSSPNAPSTTAVTDILARLDAMESQLQRLTALSEENTNSITQMESRLALLEAAPAAGASVASTVDTDDLPSTETNLDAMTGGASSAEPAEPDQSAADPQTGPSAERLAAVQQIAKPQTGDAADDEYSYGFRLWNAGFYPEARQQLSSFVEQYPDHWRVTWGRNLLGRAFLDDGMAEEAARWFLRNYQADRTAPRAPDSLLYLAEAMIAMEDTRRACIALAEFGDTYPAVASGRLLDQYEANRRRINCEA
ncbi:tetratricopeptide repeat protein [Erythrobacter sp. KMU-140]|uniref:Tetratricopeptide repeat protein n=2 Tax=Erythrobacter rubeus TaxID=2760803 RepID=A0ABR8KPT3_9SPHN|nr:tetratricopeptide repeat protein [Erythrobacter rubeus]